MPPSKRSSLLWTLAAASSVLGFAIPPSAHQARQIRDAAQLLPAYDYVIVGGGTSGLTVADRLTEDPDVTVLVLEAGALAPDADVLPITDGGTRRQPRYFFPSAPQENLGGRSIDVWLGKMVGGSSGVNAMMTLRGSKEDYDRWGQLFADNAQDWSWDGMLPYFKKLAKRFNISTDTSYWGEHSPIQASFPSFQYPGLDPLVSAFQELPGVEMIVDSGAGRAGVYWYPTFMDPVKVERSFALNAHYSNHRDRPNYHLMAETAVRRVLLDKGTAAAGVEFYTKAGNGSAVATVKAAKEILMAAGAVHTPKLLQLSGIGPRKVLEAAGLETLVDLPGVGENFQDHSNVGALIALEGLKQIHPNANDLTADPAFAKWADDLWAANRTGPHSIAYGNIAGWLPLTAIAPARFSDLAAELEAQDHSAYLAADVDATVAKGYAAQMQGLARAMRSPDTVFARYRVDPTTGASEPILNQPFSRGHVRVNAQDPFGADPVVDYRSLSNPVERAVVVEMVKWYRRFHFETSLKALGPNETAPGAEVVTDEQIAAWIPTALTPSDYHPAGTAALMPRELGGVVDQTLRVYGVKNLRVVDASIMPSLPGGNTCQPTYAIAEKAADIIKSNA
ncbi:alcohol dehydrogenase [Apiospora aurea]|uniref:Alcohol dehydrogenase n=1 Tax=Apiospora aurea TaxID=335848 RepID=A0ABR1Q9H9_9PEZI